MARAIEIRDLTVTYRTRRGDVPALRGVSLEVEQGRVVGFLGPNGAGKTTALHVLLGFVAATTGQAFVFGEDVRRSIARRRIGYLPEQPASYPFLTGREMLTASGRLFGLGGAALGARVRDLLDRMGLAEAADRRVGAYSRGMLQRIGLAQALVNDPDLVILDEPTGGLDPVGRMRVRETIADLKRRGKTVFFSSHELSEVELVCDRIAMLVGGRIAAAGRVAEMVTEGERLEQFFLRVVGAAGGSEARGR